MLSLVRDGRARPLAALALGDRTTVTADPPTIFRLALGEAADAIILAHNHVEDTPPSEADHAATRRLVAAGVVVGLPLLAHVVVTESGWYDCFAPDRPATRW